MDSHTSLHPRIHWTQVDDSVFILDEELGEYIGLNARHSLLWLDRFGSQHLDAAAPLSSELLEFTAAMQLRGWIAADPTRAPAAPPPQLVSPPPFPRLLAAACLLRAMLSLRFRGFARTYDWARSCAVPSPRNDASLQFDRPMQDFYAIEHLFVSGLGMRDCLPRSLALFVFLRRTGLPVTHRIGVKRYPFLAHAWVEYQGMPLLQQPVFGRTTSPHAVRDADDFKPIASLG